MSPLKAFLAALLLSQVAFSEEPKSASGTTSNGLRYQVRRVEGTTDAALVVLFDIGEAEDPEGKSGTAHMIEHLYVTSAAGDRKARTALEWFQAYPKGANAQTGSTWTLISGVFAATELDAEMADAAARMRDLKPVAADLERERGRVLEEVGNMFGGMPQLGAGNVAGALVAPPVAGGRRGGEPNQVAALALDDLCERWKKFYKPRNALLVVVGGIDVAATEKKVKDLFENIPAGEAPPAPSKLADAQPGTSKTLKVVTPMPQVSPCAGVAIPAPAMTDPDFPAFLLVAARVQEATQKAGMQMMYTPWERPEVLLVTAAFDNAGGGNAKLDEIRALLASCAGPATKQEIHALPGRWGSLLGLFDYPDLMLSQNLYGLALTLARAAQLGVDRPKLRAALKGLTPGGAEAAAKRFLAPERAGAAVIEISR